MVTDGQFIPGPVAVNVCTYVGYRLRGRAGALVAATAAILPAFVLVVVLSAAYFRWGQIPVVSKLFMGFIPAVTAVIVAAAWNMSRKSLVGLREEAIAIVAFAALLGIGGFYITLGIIIGGGIISGGRPLTDAYTREVAALAHAPLTIRSEASATGEPAVSVTVTSMRPHGLSTRSTTAPRHGTRASPGATPSASARSRRAPAGAGPTA